MFTVLVFTCDLALCCHILYSFRTRVTALEYGMFLCEIICGMTLLGEKIQKKVTWCSTFAQRRY